MNNVINKRMNKKIIKNPKGNVLFLVILIMLTASMMGLLTMNVLKQMFSYTIDLDGYYKSYYISKAGLELALTEINNSIVGFSNEVTGGNSIFSDNFSCGESCGLTMKVIGRSKYLNNTFLSNTGCTEDTAYTLYPGETFVIPLFYPQDNSSNKLIISGYINTGYLLSSLNTIKISTPVDTNSQGIINMGMIFRPEDLTRLGTNVLYIDSGSVGISDSISNYVTNYNYHIIDTNQPRLLNSNIISYFGIMNPNTSTVAVKFCLHSDSIEIPADKYFVVSLGEFNGKFVGLQAIYDQPIPKFMLN